MTAFAHRFIEGKNYARTHTHTHTHTFLKRYVLALMALLLLVIQAEQASAGFFTTLNPPGSINSQAKAVSGNNVVGYY